MARISGIDLPRNKRIEIGLTYIFGIGLRTSNKILENTKVNPDIRVKDLSEEQINSLRKEIENSFKVEGALRNEISQNIKRLIEIGSYRGLRHRRNLPVRGQNTHKNARTRRGVKRAPIAKKKKVKG